MAFLLQEAWPSIENVFLLVYGRGLQSGRAASACWQEPPVNDLAVTSVGICSDWVHAEVSGLNWGHLPADQPSILSPCSETSPWNLRLHDERTPIPDISVVSRPWWLLVRLGPTLQTCVSWHLPCVRLAYFSTISWLLPWDYGQADNTTQGGSTQEIIGVFLPGRLSTGQQTGFTW